MALLIENLRKDFTAPDGGVVSVLNVRRFIVSNGEQVALLGGSGTGKTTLLHAIAGIIRADSGRVIIADESSSAFNAKEPGNTLDYQPTVSDVDLTQLSEAARDVFRGQKIGYIFQTHNLLSGFTALENVLLGMSFTGRKPDRDWAIHLLTEVGLQERLDYKPAKLSVGQQQRVAVARALANRPTLVLADEPTGALDPSTAQQVLDLIRKLCREINASLIIVTHDMSIAGQLDRVVKLNELNQNGIVGDK